MARQTLARRILAHGNLQPRRAATLGLSVGGEVAWAWDGWRLGARVGAGQELLVLDSKGAEAELERLRAVLLGARAQLALAEEAHGGAVTLEALAREARDLALAEELRWDGLAQQGQGVPTAHDMARSRTVAARTAWSEAQLAIRTRKLGIVAARAGLTQADAGVASAEVAVEKHTLRAPFAGVLGADALALGSWIAPGQPLIEVLDDGSLRMLAFVSEAEAAEIAIGAKAQVQAGVLGLGDYPGRVLGRSPRADAGSRNVGLLIELDGISAGGMVSGFASVSLELPPFEEALILRRSELIWQQGTPLALVIEQAENGTLVASARSLILGRSSSGGLEVLAGLESGDRLIVGPLAALSPGSLVLAGEEVEAQVSTGQGAH
jgi:RND family efflux transporter MFP subunit